MRARRDVAVERVGGEGQLLCVADDLADPVQRAACAARGASWCGLWSTIVTRSGATAATIALGGEAGAGADVDDVEPRLVEAGERQRLVAHRRGPEQRVDPAVVARGDHAVEPARLVLVLDEAGIGPISRRGRRARRAGTRRRTASTRAGRSAAKATGSVGSSRSAQRQSTTRPSDVPGHEHDGVGVVEQQRPGDRHPEPAERERPDTDGQHGPRPEAHGEGGDPEAPVALDVGNVLEHRDREREGHGRRRSAPRRPRHRRAGDVQPDAQVDHQRAHQRDRSRGDGG